MMDNKMIVEGSLANHEVDGRVVGFRFLGRLPYYRGLGLSMVEDIEVEVDGERVPREDVRFHVRGRTYTLDEMESVYDDRWNFGEKATIIVLKDGGLTPGEHRIGFGTRLRISYLPMVPTTRDSKALRLAA